MIGNSGGQQFTLQVLLLVCMASVIASVPAPHSEMEPTSRIVNGKPVAVNDWVVALQIKDRKNPNMAGQCGGSLIDANRVLTAAHCFYDEDPPKSKRIVYFPDVKSRTRVLINSVNLEDFGNEKDESSTFIVSGVSHILVHPDYKTGSEVNDIAILYLDTPVDGDNINFIPSFAQLPSQGKTYADVNAETMGWGDNKSDGVSSNLLLKTELKAISNEQCKKLVGKKYQGGIKDFRICAKSRFAADPTTGLENDSCQGDSGGPLRVGKVLIGVVNGNPGGTVCGQPGFPGWYTRVSYYLTWIHENVDPTDSAPAGNTSG